MLSRWIKDLPFSLVHLTFLLLWLYFSIYQPSWLSISGLVVVVRTNALEDLSFTTVLE